MKISIFLVALICTASQAAPASDEQYAAKEASAEATLLPATNPANVIFRTIEAGGARPIVAPAPVRQYIIAQQPQHHYSPLSFFSAPQVQQPVIHRFIQAAAPAPVVTKFIQPAPVAFSAPAPALVKAEPEPYDTNPQYNFNWEINSDDSQVYSGHKESRDGDTVTGEYRVMDPDGSLRITRYTAGPGGYNAEVEIQKGAGPVYQAAPVAKQVIAAPAPAPVTFVAPAPVKVADDSGEKASAGFVDANVLNLGGSTRFFQAPIRYSYAAPQPQAFRYVANGGQFFSAPYASPYSYVRTVAAPRAAPVVVAKPAAFPSGTSFTRIVRGDGTTIEY